MKRNSPRDDESQLLWVWLVAWSTIDTWLDSYIIPHQHANNLLKILVFAARKKTSISKISAIEMTPLSPCVITEGGSKYNVSPYILHNTISRQLTDFLTNFTIYRRKVFQLRKTLNVIAVWSAGKRNMFAKVSWCPKEQEHVTISASMCNGPLSGNPLHSRLIRRTDLLKT